MSQYEKNVMADVDRNQFLVFSVTPDVQIENIHGSHWQFSLDALNSLKRSTCDHELVVIYDEKLSQH